MKPFPFRSPQANEIPGDLALLGSTSNEMIIPPTSAPGANTSVHQVVSQLITSLQPLAVRRNNVLLNDIPKDLSVSIDQNMLAYVLTHLVNSALESTENKCIHIEAILSGHHTTIRVKDLDTHIYHTMDLNADLSA
jgi:signal transduction histidine kinase